MLAAALEQRGVRVHAVPWDLITPGRAMVCLRSTWDYHTRLDEFRDWLEEMSERDAKVVNPLDTVQWNLDKRYLRDLERRGIAIPVTRWFDPGIRPAIDDVLEEEGWGQAVLKPRVSATAFGTHLVERGTALSADDWAQCLAAGAMVQAFVPEIRTGGEMSLMFIGGAFSHAVRKTPAAGDYRVQGEFGGRDALAQAEGFLVDFGRRVLEAAGRPWSYARVDVVVTARGPVLMELELIEPELFFYLAPSGAALLAQTLLSL